MSASDKAIRGGQPSTTQPIAGPWLSPQVVTRNRWPKELWDMASGQMPVVREMAAPSRVLYQHGLARVEATNHPITGFVLDPTIERHGQLPFWCRMPIGHTQFGGCSKELHGICSSLSGHLKGRQFRKQSEARQRDLSIGEMRQATIVGIDPCHPHRANRRIVHPTSSDMSEEPSAAVARRCWLAWRPERRR